MQPFVRSGQSQSKTCTYILGDRECNPLFVVRARVKRGGQSQSKTCTYILGDRECNPLFVVVRARVKRALIY